VSCFDEDFFANEFLGHAAIDLKDLFKKQGETPFWQPLKSKAGEMTAEIQLRAIFINKEIIR